MPPHPLTNFEIQKYYQNEARFNGVYSRDNLTKIKYEAYIINLDDYSDIGTHWVALHVQNNNANIFRIQAYDSIMCGYFYIEFIDVMLAGKTLTEFTNLFSPNNLRKNDDMILKYFMSNV